MADLKPLGSEKLAGDEKLRRILELTYYKNPNNSSSKLNTEFISESKNGGVYGITREKDGYYVKRGLNESSLDYIGGMFMKNKNKFSSYAEALKRLELLKGQQELQEATKYVLKTSKAQQESPTPELPMDTPPPMDMPPPMDQASPEMGGDLPMPQDEPSMDSESDPSVQSSKPSDYMAEVQKFAGKLGQELRDQKEKMESDDIKYVLNMIISAVNLEKLEEEDIEEIGKKFERDMDSEMDGEEIPSEEEPEMDDVTPEPEEDLSEMSAMDALESFVNTPVDMVDDTNEIDLSSYADIDEMGGEFNEEEDVELDLDEIKNSINQAVGDTLSKYFNK